LLLGVLLDVLLSDGVAPPSIVDRAARNVISTQW
jgi:hypothetical protein